MAGKDKEIEGSVTSHPVPVLSCDQQSSQCETLHGDYFTDANPHCCLHGDEVKPQHVTGDIHKSTPPTSQNTPEFTHTPPTCSCHNNCSYGNSNHSNKTHKPILNEQSHSETKEKATEHKKSESSASENTTKVEIITDSPSEEDLNQNNTKDFLLDYDRPISGSGDLEALTSKYNKKKDTHVAEQNVKQSTEPKSVTFETETVTAEITKNKEEDDSISELLCRSDSLFVNVDSGSVNTLSAETSGEICTQYSGADLSDSDLSDLNDEIDAVDDNKGDASDSDISEETNEFADLTGNLDSRKSEVGIIVGQENGVNEKVVFGLFEINEKLNKDELKTSVSNGKEVEEIQDQNIHQEHKECVVSELDDNEEVDSDDCEFKDCESNYGDSFENFLDTAINPNETVGISNEFTANKINNKGVLVIDSGKNPETGVTQDNNIKPADTETVETQSHANNKETSEGRNLTAVTRAKSELFERRQFRQRRIDSDSSAYESFYSLDNSCLTGGSALPGIVKVKKTLTWTPRVLSEERFRNSYSTGTFSDAASFYTAETSGTFFSARSFQLDSFDNFQTCEDFQQLDLDTSEPKSKFSKAKDVLVRGKEFVKAKFETYCQKLPGLGKTGNKSENPSRQFCQRTCGFSCVRVTKDISGYSINEQDITAGHRNCDSENIELKEDNTDFQDCNIWDEPGNKGHNLVNVINKSGNADITKETDGKYAAESNIVEIVQVEHRASDRKTCPGVMLKRKLAGRDSVKLAAQELVDLTNDCDIDSDDDSGLDRRRFTRDSGGDDGSSEDLTSGSGHSGSGHSGHYDDQALTTTSDMRAVQKMVSNSREVTDDREDDLPAGYEAGSVHVRQKDTPERSSDDTRTQKRLRWRSVASRTTQGTSINSSLTSNNSVEQILYQREMDPELLLNNLGFGGGVHMDDSMARVPDRFLYNQMRRRSAEMEHFMLNHPQYGHLIPTMAAGPGMGTSPYMQASGPDCEEPVFSDMPDGARNQSNRLKGQGSMQRANFSTVMNSMKFIHGAQSQVHAAPTPDEETKKISSIPSILDFPNRRALARQGFYGDEFIVKVNKDGSTEKKPISPSVSAAEKRRQFKQGSKSQSKNWSLTEDPDESAQPRRNNKFSVDSWDRGFILNSFSDRFSSDSSLEEGDSVSEEKRSLHKQNSISHLRKQYQDTIRQSIDGDYPVFTEESDNENVEDVMGASITEIRKKQVDRLMLSIDDDGDYVTNSSRLSPHKNNLVLAQKSTQSTLVGSPVTPTDANFSFDEQTGDGDNEFPSNPSSGRALEKISQHPSQQSVSIIVDDLPMESHTQREKTYPPQSRSNSNDLCLNLGSRSDSCHTLVPQDSNYEGEMSEGDLTPRPGDVSPGLVRRRPEFDEIHLSHGDALSESTSSSASQKTVIQNMGSQPGSCDLESQGSDKNSLKPTFYPPQESFELEEISSAEIAMEDWNTSMHKHITRKGPMEKSASTHSDSSGFADLDTPGETTPVIPEFNKDKAPKTDFHLNSKWQNVLSHPRSCDKQFSQNSKSAFPVPVEQNNQNGISSSDQKPVDKSKLFNVSRNNSLRGEDEVEKENVNPCLESIAYQADTSPTVLGKSVVYTVDIPVVAQQLEQPIKGKDKNLQKLNGAKFPRYISSMNVSIENIGDTASVHSNDSSTRIKSVTPVTYRKVKSSDLEQNDLDTEDEGHEQIQAENELHLDLNFLKENHHRGSEQKGVDEADGSFVQANKTKEEIANRRKSKEALVAAKSQTADWLLNSDSQNASFNIGRPNWASTPNLKPKRSHPHEGEKKRRFKRDGIHSFDLLLDEEVEYEHESDSNQGHPKDAIMTQYSMEGDFPNYSLVANRRPHLNHLAGDSACSSMDESVDLSRPSLIGSSAGIPEDHLNYLRLARLVNGPSQIMNTSRKMPNLKFTPNFHMKNWTQLPKQKLLEEETRLMQHAVQRYKTELCIMENMLFSLYSRVQSDLMPEERADVQELQQLWSQVRKEVIKMEELLSDRLRAVVDGNDSYSPLDALEIIQSMIDLLREQLYHQQMCIARDVSFTEDDMEDDQLSGCPSGVTGSDGTRMSDISSQMMELKTSIEHSQQNQKQELQDHISELKRSLLSEVRTEISSTQNSKMLQLQLQARENEVRRLKMELLLQSVNSGGTRRKQMFESDV